MDLFKTVLIAVGGIGIGRVEYCIVSTRYVTEHWKVIGTRGDYINILHISQETRNISATKMFKGNSRYRKIHTVHINTFRSQNRVLEY
jgi:hypothetical protein